MCLNPAPISARKYCTLTAVGIWPLSPCHASRGHSMIFTLSFIICFKRVSPAPHLDEPSDQSKPNQHNCRCKHPCVWRQSCPHENIIDLFMGCTGRDFSTKNLLTCIRHKETETYQQNRCYCEQVFGTARHK